MGKAQYQPPPALKWYKIKSSGLKIVFPQGLEFEAIRAASLMDYIKNKVPDTYHQPVKPISLYLNNQTTIPNGYFALAPRHMGWYTHAPQDVERLGSSDWFRMLSVHEFRHAVQFDYLNRNISMFFSSLFGEFGQSFVAFWTVPMWYFEGDAISAETLFSNQGRGRLPEFELRIKAILTGTNSKFSYNQAYLRSYKRYFPDHYQLGYFIHTHVARNYGLDTWPRVIDKVTMNPISPYSFSKGLKKNTGANVNRTYKNTIVELKTKWLKEDFSMLSELVPIAVNKSRIYTNYRYGHKLTDNSFICLKYGMADAPELVRIDTNGTETVLRSMNNDMFISSNGHKIAWNTLTSDIRWGMRDYSDIMMMDAGNGTIKKLTQHAKYVSPAVSPGGNKIAAVRYGDDMTYYIDIIDAKNGEAKNEFKFTSPDYIRTPSWSDDETEIIYTVTANSVTRIEILEINSGVSKIQLVTNSENISKPIFWKGYILFVSSVRGTNEIHALNLGNKKRFIALNGGYGFFNPTASLQNEEIILESYTPGGYRLYTWKPDTNKFEFFENTIPVLKYISPVIEAGNYENIFENYKQSEKQYKIKKYNLFSDGLRLHSWAILPSYQGIQGMIYANDPLSVAGVTAGIQYNQNEKNALQFISLNYSGIFPVLNLRASTGHRTMFKEYITDSSDYFQWNESAVSANISLPFNLSSEAKLRNLNFSVGYNYTFIKNLDNKFKDVYDFGNGSFGSINTRISYAGYQQMSLRDFYPKQGIMFDAEFYSTTSGSDYHGSLFSVSSTIFLKGLAKHHSFRLHIAYENQKPGSDDQSGYIYPSGILFFRGYQNIFSEKITKFSADYALPLAYPDLGMGSVLYIKRIRTNFFTDFGRGQNRNFNEEYFSFGIDLLFDINIFRFISELDLGTRVTFNGKGNYSAEFIAFQRFGY